MTVMLNMVYALIEPTDFRQENKIIIVVAVLGTPS
jgi:hypothetical protein